MAKLNKNQAEAVCTTEGKVLILAGAGSGKTRVLVHRIAYLIEKRQVLPSAILGLTFTNKAAREMEDRVSSMIGKKQGKQVMLSTFHSFCMKVLRQEIHKLGFTKQFSLYDEKEMRRLTTHLVKDLLEKGQTLSSLEPTFQLIKEAKNKGLQASDIPPTGLKWYDQFIKKLYDHLHISLRANNAVDFDHLMTLTVHLFENFPEVLDQYQEKYRV